MGFKDMSHARRRAWLEIVGWGVAGTGFGVTFFIGGGPVGFAEESSRHLAGAGALAFGFLIHWLALWSTRQKADGPPVFDERDYLLMARANQASLVVVLVGVFALAIGLWAVYEERGSVPAGWMWFMAYGSVILAFLTSSVATLVLDRGGGGHG